MKRAAQTFGVVLSAEERVSVPVSTPPTTMEVDSNPISEPQLAMSRIEQEHQHRLTDPVVPRALMAAEKVTITEQERYLQHIGGEEPQRAAVPLRSPPSLELLTGRDLRSQNLTFPPSQLTLQTVQDNM